MLHEPARRPATGRLLIKKDTDLDALRDRADFQELLGQLQARSSKDPK